VRNAIRTQPTEKYDLQYFVAPIGATLSPMNLWNSLPVVTKNIIIICVLMFLGSNVIKALEPHLVAHYFRSEYFKPWQIVTHMFMHGSLSHLFFNMFGLFMFGKAVEYYWGAKKFLNYYLVCGLGAVCLHQAWTWYEIEQLATQVSPRNLALLYDLGSNANFETTKVEFDHLQHIFNLMSSGMLGASGCLFGVLVAFGMMFPNAEMFMMFIPIPIKAKYMVAMYGVFELLAGFSNRSGDNVAHFAHLGGLLTGLIILLVWKKQGKLFS
jgi:membrane associated rhomboid family serine protease